MVTVLLKHCTTHHLRNP